MEMTLNSNFLTMENDELDLINAGCWLYKLGAGLVMIGDVLFAIGSSGILCFVGVVVAIVGGILALLS